MATTYESGIRRPMEMYAAEDSWARDLPERYRKNLSRQQVFNLVQKICEDYMRPMPHIRWTGKRGGATGSKWRLMFTHNSKHRRTPTWLVLHEMAHSLAPLSSLHDMAWLKIYADLCEQHISKKAGKQCLLLLGAHLPE